jgi:hypothetical protein
VRDNETLRPTQADGLRLRGYSLERAHASGARCERSPRVARRPAGAVGGAPSPWPTGTPDCGDYLFWAFVLVWLGVFVYPWKQHRRRSERSPELSARRVMCRRCRQADHPQISACKSGIATRSLERLQILDQICLLARRQAQIEKRVVVVDHIRQSGEAAVVEEPAFRVRKQPL